MLLRGGIQMTQDHFYTEVETGVLNLSHVRRSQHYNMLEEHAHPEWELYFLLSGERLYFIRDHLVQVRKGDLVLIPAGEVHKSLPVKGPIHERICLDFLGEFLEPVSAAMADLNLLNVFKGGRLFRMKETDQQWVQRELFRMLAEARDSNGAWEDAVRLILANILLFLRRCDAGQPVIDGSRSPTLEWLLPLLQHLSEHYMEQLTLSGIAALFYLHPSYLSRAFHKATGMTFINYLAEIRVREGRGLLETTQMPTALIGEACGFGDGIRFGRVFKRITGQTPGGYRKSSRGKSHVKARSIDTVPDES
jgi:AraC family transcriptional regulator, arabinose operon regulatory protein